MTLLESLEHLPVEKLQTTLPAYHQQKIQLEIQKEQFRTQLNRFFNTPGENLRLTGTPPSISYSNKLEKLSLQQGFGKLGLKLQTIAIEASLLTTWNAKSNRIPQINLGVSAPPLASSSGGSDINYFDLEETRLFSGASYTIRLRDPLNQERVRDAETRARLTRQQLQLNTENETSRLNLLKKRYQFLLRQQKILSKKLSVSKSKNVDNLSPENILNQINKVRDNTQRLSDLQDQQKQLDLQIWVWDDAYWNKAK